MHTSEGKYVQVKVSEYKSGAMRTIEGECIQVKESALQVKVGEYN